MKLTDYTTLNGISLTKPESNLLEKLNIKYGLIVSENETTARNMCSGAKFTVSPLSAALVNFLNEAYRTYALFGTMHFNGNTVAVGTFDRVKYLLMKLDSETYSNTID
jgi:hypothetical protein